MSLLLFQVDLTTQLQIPILGDVSAGFPSPASDFIEQGIDLNKELIKRPSATFFVRVSGSSMKGACIHDGDLLIVDRSLPHRDNSIVVCYLDGEFTLKRLKVGDNECFLIPENDEYSAIRVTSDNSFVIWGVVAYNIKSFVCTH